MEGIKIYSYDDVLKRPNQVFEIKNCKDLKNYCFKANDIGNEEPFLLWGYKDTLKRYKDYSDQWRSFRYDEGHGLTYKALDRLKNKKFIELKILNQGLKP